MNFTNLIGHEQLQKIENDSEGVNLILIERDSILNPQNMCVGKK